jgi:hypothetical protein
MFLDFWRMTGWTQNSLNFKIKDKSIWEIPNDSTKENYKYTTQNRGLNYEAIAKIETHLLSITKIEKLTKNYFLKKKLYIQKCEKSPYYPQFNIH